MPTSPGPNPSLFSGAQGVHTHGGEHYVAGRDVIHNHFYNSPGHSSGHPHENDANVIPDRPEIPAPAGSSGPLFRFPDVSRFFRIRTLDVDIISIVEAEYSSLLSRSSTMVPQVSETYLRLMLKHRHGYPLYHPEPKRGLPIEYRRKGIRIGDVGRITPDGAFDFLFNVDSSQAGTVNPPILPRGFETIPPIESLSEDYFHPDEHLLSSHVYQIQDMPVTYKFSAPEGSVLQLPEGATLFEAKNMNDLHNLATRHAQSWYEYMATQRSVDIPNGSLYIVTGCIKTRNWGIGTLYERPSDRDYLTFISEDQSPRRKYGWRKSGPIMTKVGPTSTDIIMTDDDDKNQCVFIRGYKIALGDKLWKKVRKSVSILSKKGGDFNISSSSSVTSHPGGLGTQNNSLGRSGRTKGSASDHIMHSEKDSTDHEGLHQSIDDMPISDELDGGPETLVLEPIVSAASPVHPSDIIISVLAHVEPEAEVILVHDKEWCSLLPNNFAENPWNLDVKGLLKRITQFCVAALDHNACASLARATEAAAGNAPHDAQELDTADEIISPTSPNSLNTIMTASNLHFPNEIVEEILNHLDLLSKMKCRAVCSAFRELIDSSPYFHWQRELALSGMEDGGNYPLVTRRQMLEQHQQGWTKMRWSKEQREKHMGGVSHTNGTVFAQTDSTRTVMHVSQAASPSRNIEERSWIINTGATRLGLFDMDTSQDLLVIFGKFFEQQSQHIHQIFIWTLSTGDPHPLATETHVLTHSSIRQQQIQYRHHSICGQYLCVVFHDTTTTEAEIKIWDWKTGQVVANIEGDRLRDAKFISERHIIIASEQEPCLIVIDLIVQPQEKQKIDGLENAYTFGFPPLAETAGVSSVDFIAAPGPTWKPSPGPRVPFFTTRNDRLRVISLVVDDGSGTDPEAVIFSPDSTFLSLIESATRLNTTHFDWSMWGPDGTRMIVLTSSAVWYTAYGMKFASTLQLVGKPANYVHVYDFNQLALKWSQSHGNGEAELKKDGAVGCSTSEGETGDSSQYINVTEPTKVAAGSIFQDDIETRLGYRANRWAIPGQPSVRYPEFCGEDGIRLWYGESDVEEVHTLTF